MYNAIVGSGILNAKFADGEIIWLNAQSSKWSCAAMQKLVVSAGVELVCILIFRCDQKRSTKDYIFIQFVTWSLEMDNRMLKVH